MVGRITILLLVALATAAPASRAQAADPGLEARAQRIAAERGLPLNLVRAALQEPPPAPEQEVGDVSRALEISRRLGVRVEDVEAALRMSPAEEAIARWTRDSVLTLAQIERRLNMRSGPSRADVERDRWERVAATTVAWLLYYGGLLLAAFTAFLAWRAVRRRKGRESGWPVAAAIGAGLLVCLACRLAAHIDADVAQEYERLASRDIEVLP